MTLSNLRLELKLLLNCLFIKQKSLGKQKGTEILNFSAMINIFQLSSLNLKTSAIVFFEFLFNSVIKRSMYLLQY